MKINHEVEVLSSFGKHAVDLFRRHVSILDELIPAANGSTWRASNKEERFVLGNVDASSLTIRFKPEVASSAVWLDCP